MHYSLKIWTRPGTDENRLYIGGTSRQSLYFCRGKEGDLRWSSKANDTPHRFQTGDHHGKIRKDQTAAEDVAAAFGWTLAETPFEVALQVARDGIAVEA